MHHNKLIIGITLTIILALLMIYSSIGHNIFDPDIDYIVENFEEYNNTQVSFSGEIIEINQSNNNMSIKVLEPPYIKLNIHLNNTKQNLKKGDYAQILGILDGKNHVTAEKILRIDRWEHNLIYLRSLPAIPFALYLFFKTWKFNKETYRFERRKKNA
jgi:hypothetical protein